MTYDFDSGAFLGEFKNGEGSNVGSCQDKIAEGDDVLYAYAPFDNPLLKLTGPRTANPDDGTAALRVTNAATGKPIAGAAVGSVTTGPDGVAHVPISEATNTFKATKPGTVRSNRLTVCGSTGSDGVCGAADTTAPVANLLDIAEKQRFARNKGPRHLRVHVNPDPSGLSEVKLRLSRNAPGPGHFTYFSGRLERFKRGRLIRGSRCGARRAYWFSVGSDADVDFLLPKRLGSGRYVLDAKAIDKAGNRDDERQRGRNRVVFYVR